MPSSLGAYTPTFMIYKGGENITANFNNRALDIRVELASGHGAQDTCTITVDDRDWLLALPQVDDGIEVYLGYEEVGMAFMGTFEIDEVTLSFPPKQISIHGNSEGFNSAFKSPKTQAFSGSTLGEIVNKIAKDLGMEAVVDPSLASKQIPYRNVTVSPMHLLVQLEREFNGVSKMGQGKLSFNSRDSDRTAGGQYVPIVVLQKEHLASAQVKHGNRSDYTSVSAQYKDGDSNTIKTVTSKSAVDGLVGGNADGSNKDFPLKFQFPTKEQAQNAADSQMKALDRTLGEGLFTLAQGDPWIRDQNRILVIGTRDGIDGSYIADIVSHHYSKETGITTSIRTDATADGSSFEPIYGEDPNGAKNTVVAPAPGQVTGEVRPQQGGPNNANPAMPPNSTPVQQGSGPGA